MNDHRTETDKVFEVLAFQIQQLEQRAKNLLEKEECHRSIATEAAAEMRQVTEELELFTRDLKILRAKRILDHLNAHPARGAT